MNQLVIKPFWFLAYQIEWKMLIKAAVTTTLHCEFPNFLQRFQMSSMDWKWRAQFRI